VSAVWLDAGYFTPVLCKGIVERGLYGMGYTTESSVLQASVSL
jgi:hypothetical protein